ncbi:molybdopterin converting factor subunit 1 [Alkalihalophilus pseudofirmus]|nr:molybdopterin converting factor subunit 1 [Alkalihalophilus pseudofirmus]
MIKVLFFAGLAEKTGQTEVELDLQDVNIEALEKKLVAEFPVIENDVKNSMVAVNEELADENTVLKANDTVAFIPPVSGG